MTIAAALDHVVINVHAALDQAAATYERLGFRLTMRGHHTLGSSNHLAMFGTDYLELLGHEPERGPAPSGMAARPAGLAGLAFKPPADVAVDAALAAAGVGSGASMEFSRPVALPGGLADARFRITQVSPAETSFGQVFFCHHFTPELVWRPEWQTHPNGVTGIAEVVMTAADPAQAAAPFGRMFGAAALRPEAGGVAVALAGGARVLCLDPAAVAERFAGMIAMGDGAGDRMVALGFRTCDLGAARAALTAGGVPTRNGDGWSMVGAGDACGAAVTFFG